MQKLFILLLSITFLTGCKSQKNIIAPETFIATFETTQGTFDVEVTRAWSPKAADRLYELIKSRYYDNAPFYRVVPGFVAQFGNTDTLKNEKWKSVKVPDEPVLYSNKKGTLSYARAGKETRGFDLFINLTDNIRLDTIDYEGVKGFPAFGTVVKGMDVVEKLYSGYAETTMEDEALFADQERLLQTFPKLDRIKKAYISSQK